MSEGEIKIPLQVQVAPKTDCAYAAAKAWEFIRPFVARGCDVGQFYAACISEFNLIFDKDVEPMSAPVAMKNLAMVGLPPGSALKLAYFVPFKKGERKLLQVVIGYRGYIELAFAGNFLRDLHSDVVLAGESIEFWKDESGPRLKHMVDLNRTETMQNVIGAYCIYHTRNQGRGVFLVQGPELHALCKKQSSRGDSPWKNHPLAMCRKTAVRRAANEWPQVPALKLALRLDELVEDLDQEQGDMSGTGTLLPAQKKIDLNGLPETP